MDISEIEKALKKKNGYVIASIEGKGNYIGRINGVSLDADGDLIIECDIDNKSVTG